MNHRVNTVACALLVSALVVPASQASEQRAPVKRHQLVAHARSNAFASLGHEGSALRKVESGTSRHGSFTNSKTALKRFKAPRARSRLRHDPTCTPLRMPRLTFE